MIPVHFSKHALIAPSHGRDEILLRQLILVVRKSLRADVDGGAGSEAIERDRVPRELGAAVGAGLECEEQLLEPRIAALGVLASTELLVLLPDEAGPAERKQIDPEGQIEGPSPIRMQAGTQVRTLNTTTGHNLPLRHVDLAILVLVELVEQAVIDVPMAGDQRMFITVTVSAANLLEYPGGACQVGLRHVCSKRAFQRIGWLLLSGRSPNKTGACRHTYWGVCTTHQVPDAAAAAKRFARK